MADPTKPPIREAADGTIRASAVLPNSGAYDTPIALDLRGMQRLRLHIRYTRGAANGAAKLKLEFRGQGSTYERECILDGASLSSGVITAGRLEIQLPVSTSAAEEGYTLPFDVGDALYAKISFAEYGVTVTPGTLSCTGTLVER